MTDDQRLPTSPWIQMLVAVVTFAIVSAFVTNPIAACFCGWMGCAAYWSILEVRAGV